MVKILKNGNLIDFGEEQIPYTISKVKDETFNTCSIIVESQEKQPLDPSTMLLLDNEYWYVDRDKSIYKSNGNSIHNISLVDLSEILNDRFVEDCKFAQNTYTYKSGIDRLLKLANSTDISIKYPDIHFNEIEFQPTTYYKTDGNDEHEEFFIIKNKNEIKDDFDTFVYNVFGVYQIKIGNETITKNFTINLEHKSITPIYQYIIDGKPIDLIRMSAFDSIQLGMENHIGLHWGEQDIKVNYVRILEIKVGKSKIYSAMPTFQFQDYNLFNALNDIFKSLGYTPRLRYNNGLELYFYQLGENKNVIHDFNEIKDIEVTRESSRNANASTIISNCKNISGDEYVWFPSSMYGRPLYPENSGTSLSQDDIGIFTFNSNAKHVRKVRVFPKLLLYVGGEKVLSTYYDDNFFWASVNALSTKITKNSAIDIITKLCSMYENGNVFVDIEDGGIVKTYPSIVYTGAGLIQVDINYKLACLREKKKYDLLTHKYVFDSINLDEKEQSIYWEQGNDYIRGFDKEVFNSTTIFKSQGLGASVDIVADFSKDSVRIAAEYLPQEDIRIKTYNNSNYGITKQYNQSGKMIDYSATKKDLQNYINNMESRDVIVNALYNDKSMIYDVGDILYDSETNTKYIITNESIQVNGGNNYDVIYQLNENYIRRSEFISADSDIRDYDIPITNLVERQKTFKDKLEFSYTPKGYDSRINAETAMNVFIRSGYINVDGSAYVLSSQYDLMLLYCKYKNGKDEMFSLPVTILGSNNVNSKVFSLKIPDNYIIGWTSTTSYNAQNILEPIFSSFDISTIIDASGKVYTPIRYTDLDGEIQSMEILLVKSCKLQEMDYNLGTYNTNSTYLGRIYLNMPYVKLDSNLTPRDIYLNLKQNLNDIISIQINDLLKDRYETLSFSEEIEYVGSENIEITPKLTQNGNNELFYNKIEVCKKIRLYRKDKYTYIDKDTILDDDFYLEMELGSDNVSLNYFDDQPEISITFDSSQAFRNYNIAIVDENNDLMIALNNNDFNDGNNIKFYLNGYKY